jgi:NADH-quinone oxidoreductase subunit C
MPDPHPQEVAPNVHEDQSPSPPWFQGELDAIEAAAPEAVLDVVEGHGMVWIRVKRESIIVALQTLRDTPTLDYQMLSDLFGIDFPERDERFDIVYNLLSLSRMKRLYLRLSVGEGQEVETATGLFRNADWAEREIFDLFGVTFRNHPDLRRILTPDDWQGHPLRKDYPVTGRRAILLYDSVEDIA